MHVQENTYGKWYLYSHNYRRAQHNYVTGSEQGCAPQSMLTFVVQRRVAQSGRRLQVIGPGNQNSQITPVNPLVARRERVQQELHARSHPTGVLCVKVKIRVVVDDEISRKP